LLLALQWGGSTYPWKSGRVIALFVVFGVLTIAFIAVQAWKQEAGTVPPRIIKTRSIWAGACFAFFQGATFFTFVFYVGYNFSIQEDFITNGFGSCPSGSRR
jgi:hypothetical protein